MRKRLSVAIGFACVPMIFGSAVGQLDDAAKELLRKEIEELSQRKPEPAEPEWTPQRIEDLRKKNLLQQKEIEQLKEDLKRVTSDKPAPEPPVWGKEALFRLSELGAMAGKAGDINSYLRDFQRTESELQKLMGDEVHPVRAFVLEALACYRTAGEIWRWKSRPERRRDPRDTSNYLYAGGDPDLRRWLGQYPFLQLTVAPGVVSRTRGRQTETLGRFNAYKAIVALWGRADRVIEKIKFFP